MIVLLLVVLALFVVMLLFGVVVVYVDVGVFCDINDYVFCCCYNVIPFGLLVLLLSYLLVSLVVILVLRALALVTL